MRSPLLPLAALITATVLAAAPASAWDNSIVHPSGVNPSGLLVLDGSYVMNVGRLHVNISNFGMIGSQHSVVSTFNEAASAQWPGGSQDEYLFSAGPWIGGVKNGEKLVSTGQFERELRPLDDPRATIYEARYGASTRPSMRLDPHGSRIFESGADDDGDGRLNEETLNGFDDDLDGLIDEDFEMFGSQMMVCTMVDNTPIAAEEYPDHRPLDLEVVQSAFAWETDDIDDFIVFTYDIKNIGSAAIENLRFGMFVDGDIARRDKPGGAFDDYVGHFTGLVQGADALYEDVDVAYMYDGAGEDPLPGYIGVMYMGPSRIGSVQHYTGIRPYILGGDPTNDAERYAELEKHRSDPDVAEGRMADYRFLASEAASRTLPPGGRAHIELILVCGLGLEGLLTNCAQAVRTWEGSWYDLDDDKMTGWMGRETLRCVDDFDDFIDSGLGQMTAAYADLTCLPEWAERPILFGDLSLGPDGRYCIWINGDNCDECRDILGRPCSLSNFFNVWDCGSWTVPEALKEGCTGVDGRETHILWTTESAPPPPGLRAWATDLAVYIYWRDDSEYVPDIVTHDLDFESYRIWRADDWDRPPGTSERTGPALDLWGMIAEFDLDNVYIDDWLAGHPTAADTLPLGRNTGLEVITYRPRILGDPRFAGLEDAMSEVVAAGVGSNGKLRPPVRTATGGVNPGMEPVLPWEAYPSALDTFYWAAAWEGGPGEIPPKRGTRFYEYVDRDVHNGFLYFYSVTATDHDMYMGFQGPVITGEGIGGSPSASFVAVRPGTRSRTADDIDRNGQRIFVYPNPATRSALAEFQSMQPNSDDPTGVRVMFANLPAARGTVEIFTLNGDLVQTVPFDGTQGAGEVPWNLVSRNGQQIVSGLYLYSVRVEDAAFDDFIGKFAVIR